MSLLSLILAIALAFMVMSRIAVVSKSTGWLAKSLGFALRHWFVVLVLAPLIASGVGAIDLGKSLHQIRKTVASVVFRGDSEEAKYLRVHIDTSKKKHAADKAEAEAILAALDRSGQSQKRRELAGVFERALADDSAKIERLEARYLKLLESRVETLVDRIADEPDNRTDNALDLGRTLVAISPTAAPTPEEAAVHKLFDLIGAPAPDLAAIAKMFVLSARSKITAESVARGYADLAQRASVAGAGVELKPITGREAFQVTVNGSALAVIMKDAAGQWLFETPWF